MKGDDITELTFKFFIVHFTFYNYFLTG